MGSPSTPSQRLLERGTRWLACSDFVKELPTKSKVYWHFDQTEGDPEVKAGDEPTDAEIRAAAARYRNNNDEDGTGSEPKESDDGTINESTLDWPGNDSQRDIL